MLASVAAANWLLEVVLLVVANDNDRDIWMLSWPLVSKAFHIELSDKYLIQLLYNKLLFVVQLKSKLPVASCFLLNVNRFARDAIHTL